MAGGVVCRMVCGVVCWMVSKPFLNIVFDNFTQKESGWKDFVIIFLRCRGVVLTNVCLVKQASDKQS